MRKWLHLEVEQDLDVDTPRMVYIDQSAICAIEPFGKGAVIYVSGHTFISLMSATDLFVLMLKMDELEDSRDAH